MASAPKVKYDPLEAAKLGTDQAKAFQPDPAPVPAPEPDPQPPATPPPSPRPKFRVMKDFRVSIRGQVCNFKAGRVIDSAGYDVDGLRRQGLELEEVK